MSCIKLLVDNQSLIKRGSQYLLQQKNQKKMMATFALLMFKVHYQQERAQWQIKIALRLFYICQFQFLFQLLVVSHRAKKDGFHCSRNNFLRLLTGGRLAPDPFKSRCYSVSQSNGTLKIQLEWPEKRGFYYN